MEAAVILQPSLQDRSEHGRRVVQILVAFQLHSPSPDLLPHGLEGVAADGRREVRVNAAILVHRLAGAKRVAEKRELDSGVFAEPIDVLAIHDPCLARMQFELAGMEPLPDAIKHVFRLPSALAVKHRVIRVPGEPDARQMPRHPQIKRIVQKQIRQDRRHDTSLRRALVALQDLTLRSLHWRFQPAFHVEQYPGFLTVLAQSRHQEAMVEIVEQPPNVELHDPVTVPTPTSGDGDRLQRRLARPVAVGILVEERIEPWLQPHLDRRLRDPVGHRRDAQDSDAT